MILIYKIMICNQNILIELTYSDLSRSCCYKNQREEIILSLNCRLLSGMDHSYTVVKVRPSSRHWRYSKYLAVSEQQD